jgi:transposase-like protein
MSDDLEDLERRLVVGHKSDGRSVYDESAKAELVALCMQPDASVSRLARECGVNANQVGRWLREHGQGRRRTAVASASPMRSGSGSPLLRPTRGNFSGVCREINGAPFSCDGRPGHLLRRLGGR